MDMSIGDSKFARTSNVAAPHLVLIWEPTKLLWNNGLNCASSMLLNVVLEVQSIIVHAGLVVKTVGTYTGTRAGFSETRWRGANAGIDEF